MSKPAQCTIGLVSDPRFQRPIHRASVKAEENGTNLQSEEINPYQTKMNCLNIMGDCWEKVVCLFRESICSHKMDWPWLCKIYPMWWRADWWKSGFQSWDKENLELVFYYLQECSYLLSSKCPLGVEEIQNTLKSFWMIQVGATCWLYFWTLV